MKTHPLIRLQGGVQAFVSSTSKMRRNKLRSFIYKMLEPGVKFVKKGPQIVEISKDQQIVLIETDESF